MEFVKRFYSVALGVPTNGWTRDAADYFATAADKGLLAFPNGGTVGPRPDDILVFSGKRFGHVAIITSVSATSIDLIEQNWSVTGSASLTYSISNGKYTIQDRGRSFKVLGWLRTNGPQAANPIYSQNVATTYVEEKQSSSDHGTFPIDVTFPLIATFQTGTSAIQLSGTSVAHINVSRSEPGCYHGDANPAIYVYIFANALRTGDSFTFRSFHEPDGSDTYTGSSSTGAEGSLTTLAANTTYYVFLNSQCSGDRLKIQTNDNHQFYGSINQ